MPAPTGRTPEQLRADAWAAFTKASDAGCTLTPHGLAEAAGLTVGGAHRFLTDWHAQGRATPLPATPSPGPHNTAWTTPPVIPADPVRVLVTGSRDWTHQPTITAALDRVRAEHGPRLVLVHGACPTGADAIADTWARAHRVPVEAHPADWSAHGRAAGPRRNAAMVATRPALCLAFIRNASPGATGCARLAEDAGIPTTRHTTHPTERRAPAVPMPLAPAAPEPQEPITPALRAAALSYAARGWHVIPLRPGGKSPAFPNHTQDRCTGTDPRCRQAGRHVIWEERATTCPDRITRGWSSQFGIGIACGPSGLVVVDLDIYKPSPDPAKRARRVEELAALGLPEDADGAAVLAAIVAARGLDLPDTYTVATPSGGRHLYFTAPPGVRLTNTAKTLAPSVDTRAWGGQVVAPPSAVDGAAYRVTVDAPVVALPDWIADALRPAPRKPIPARTTAPAAATDGSRADAYVRAALSAEASHVAQAAPGERNLALFVAAANLGELVAGGALDADDARAVLMAAATVHIGTERFTATEADKTITSGLRKGAGRPRPIVGEAA